MTPSQIKKIILDNFHLSGHITPDDAIIFIDGKASVFDLTAKDTVRFIDGKLPVSFKYANKFVISHCELTTLEGSPEKVDNIFSCSNNKLSNLFGAPLKVGTFVCRNNPLTSLEYLPEITNRIRISNNHLPLLRLIKLKSDITIEILKPNNRDFDENLEEIIKKYIGRPTKKTMLEFQNELIENGYGENAGW